MELLKQLINAHAVETLTTEEDRDNRYEEVIAIWKKLKN
jgi:hypothetical protein